MTDNSSEPSISPERWEPRIKKFLTSIILAPNQQIHSFNSRPYFMVIFTIFRVILLIDHIVSLFTTTEVGWRFKYTEYVLITTTIGIITVFAHIFIAIPFEIAHGNLLTFVCYLAFHIYPFIVGKVILDNFNPLQTNPSLLALLGIYLSNLFAKGNEFSHRKLRIIIPFIVLTIPEFWFVHFIHDLTYWILLTYYLTINLAGGLIGFVLGYYWVYQKEDKNIQIMRWKCYAKVLTWLVLFLVITELSDLHLTTEEYLRGLSRYSKSN